MTVFKVVGIICTLLVVLIGYNIQTIQDRQRYRHNSTAPVRKNGRAVWFVDGKDYMFAVADAIELAKLEIMIMDWQMNPEIFMKRSETGVDNLKWRLDNILLRKADQGVKVFILLYWEPKTFLDLGSDHVMKLLGKHENIEIHRHPDTLRVWSPHEKMVIIDRCIAFIGGIDLAYGRWDTRNHDLMDDYPVHSAVSETKANEDSFSRHARWIGKDYINSFWKKQKEMDWDKPFEGYEGVDRNKIPRMPWHDVSCAFTGEAVNDAVKHFTDRYKHISFSRRFNWNAFWLELQFIWSEKFEVEQVVLNHSAHNVNIQLLRSVAQWSASLEPEKSIYHAYLDMIKNAEHFIYIENQFFVSSQKGFFRYVQNEIQSVLVERIVKAHKANEDFYVILVIPLKPEFPADWDSNDWNGDALRSVTYWNQATLYHGNDSLFAKLEKNNISKEIAKKYVSVYSLRTFDQIGSDFVTEIVYVHSKIMIVDDRKAIIGSANINDRSMMGDRDSEVAVVIEDLDMIDGKMNGSNYRVGEFAHSLRCDVIKEHLGLLAKSEDEFEIHIDDPLANSFIESVSARARKNNETFFKVFGSSLFPREGIHNLKEFKVLKNFSLVREATNETREILNNIKGNLVEYPYFLKEVLKPSSLDPLGMYVMVDQRNRQIRSYKRTSFSPDF